MSSEIAVFENTLKPLTNQFNDLLAGIMPAERLIQSAIVCVTKNPKLLDANRQSFLNTIRGSAILGLEMDGTTGQAFPIPFAGMVQLVIGYKGYNTLGARAGLTITGEVVREADVPFFDIDIGQGYVSHKPPLHGDRGKVIGAWAKAAANNRPSVVTYLSLADILAIKAKSPGAKKSDSPWNDPPVGFPAMGSKSAKRRLTRSTPLTVEAPQMHLAARMEEAFEERGRLAYVVPGNQIDEIVIDTIGTSGQPSTDQLLNPPKPMSDLLILARAKAFEGPAVVAPWFEKLPEYQRLELKVNLPDLRALANNPENFLMAEGKEAAEGTPGVLAAWWGNVPDVWKTKLERYYTETLMPLAGE